MSHALPSRQQGEDGGGGCLYGQRILNRKDRWRRLGYTADRVGQRVLRRRRQRSEQPGGALGATGDAGKKPRKGHPERDGDDRDDGMKSVHKGRSTPGSGSCQQGIAIYFRYNTANRPSKKRENNWAWRRHWGCPAAWRRKAPPHRGYARDCPRTSCALRTTCLSAPKARRAREAREREAGAAGEWRNAKQGR